MIIPVSSPSYGAFWDLVSSTGIAPRIDPEEWHEIVANYHCTASRAIEDFGRYAAKYLTAA
jgi:hypothetical protein